MKKIAIMTILLISLITNVNSQSRNNKVVVNFNSKSEKITTATGWELNDKTGKWVDNQNVIDDTKTPSYWISHVSQNFKSIQFATIILNDVKHYVFLYEKWSGTYKYPNIQEDWEPEMRTYFFVLSSEQYETLRKNIDLKAAKNIKISSKTDGFMTDRFKILKGEHLYNEENLSTKINLKIEKPNYSESCLVFNSQDVDGVSVIRFRLPESCYSAEKNMETGYFEIPLNDFKKILLE